MTQIHDVLQLAAETWGVSVREAEKRLTLERTKALRLNTLKSRKSTLSSLKKADIHLKPVKWADNCFEVTSGYDTLSRHETVLRGEVYLQNAASFVPTLALDPNPGEHILDIAAAPGGKTSHIAALTGNRGRLVANDTSRSRFFRMRELLEMLQVRSEYTLYDGRDAVRRFGTNTFDKVLLDAPCSGEASMNPADASTYGTWSTAKVRRLSRLQQQLIAASFDVLKVGGTLVYSTCTINPYENEMVVASLLKRRPAQIAHISAKPTDALSGRTSFRDRDFPAELSSSIRLLPTLQHEAFYVAKIIKLADNNAEDAVYF